MKTPYIVAGLFLVFSATATAGVLMKEWTELNNRYCEYSDGEVKKVEFNNVSPRTN